MQTLSIQAQVDEVTPHATAIRHRLHRHPELMYEERCTAETVTDELEELGIEYKAGLAGGTGVIGWLPATTRAPGAAPTVGLRADMDALPISEETELPYASENPGVMHACGHDGHTAVLLGAARVLAGVSQRANNVLLLFQPAEEGGAGGDRMCRDGALGGAAAGGLGQPVDIMYGLHGWPELPVGKVATRVGPLLAATDEFTITVRGKGCHAAYPHLGLDPVVIAAEMVTALQSIPARRVSPLDNVIITVGSIHAGHAHNVIPEEVRMLGTIRTLLASTRTQVEQDFRRLVSGIGAAHGAEVDINWHEGYPVTRNDPEATARFRRIASATLGEDNVLEREHPTMGGEDFSYYGQRVPACFYFVGLCPPGVAEYPNLHTPRFDFNDDALPLAIGLTVQLALDAL
ncbi:MAG: amidohydrolase [Phycisphaerales bacterium]|nr:amidohydrolase [Phycisphaerales bacterium]